MNSAIDKTVKATTYRELKLQNELLRAEAVVNEKAMAAMSREICDLNGELQKILDEVQSILELVKSGR